MLGNLDLKTAAGVLAVHAALPHRQSGYLLHHGGERDAGLVFHDHRFP
jgi:hypothetical protein